MSAERRLPSAVPQNLTPSTQHPAQAFPAVHPTPDTRHPTPVHAVIAAVVLLVGGIVVGATGFGIGLSTTPVLLLFMEPQTVVVLLNTISLAILAALLRETWRDLNVREVAPITVAGMLGVPVGVYALSTLSPSALRIGIAALVLGLTVLMTLNIQVTFPKPRVSGPLVGFVTSALVTGLSIGGPLIALFFLSRTSARNRVRASMAMFFLATEIVAVGGYAVAGLFTMERLLLVLVVLIPSLIGYRIAYHLVRRISDKTFRHGVVVFIAISSIVLLTREALSL